MKALIMREPGSLQVDDVPAPVRTSGEALLQVRYVSMAETADWLRRWDQQPNVITKILVKVN